MLDVAMYLLDVSKLNPAVRGDPAVVVRKLAHMVIFIFSLRILILARSKQGHPIKFVVVLSNCDNNDLETRR